jgi:hypothetical protein
MGIDYRAAIFVGLPRKEISNIDNFEELLGSDEFEVRPPCYDGNSEDYAIVGFEVWRSGIYCASEFTYDEVKVSEAKDKFKALTGLEGKLWISPYGY